MDPQAYERERAHLALAHINQVRRKLECGRYRTELNKCFCGSEQEIELVKTERYGLPHRMVVCKQCALIRANPRMTVASYRDFYNQHYRRINFPFYAHGSVSEAQDTLGLYQIQVRKGEELQQLIYSSDFEPPKSVIDIGCFLGGMLAPFKADGAKCWGIEIDQGAATVARASGVDVFPSIEEAISHNVKADLVIMQDVIEHLHDLSEMSKVGQLLNPNGYLYVWTPGYFRSDVSRLWQIAHTYQFCARSLEYVMSEIGFDEIFLDEEITSFWHHVGPQRSIKFETPSEWADYIIDEVTSKEKRRLPPFRGVCKFNGKTLYANMDANLARKLPDLYDITKTRSGGVLILGGGPSVDVEAPMIVKMSSNMPVMCISRMYPWCVAHGINPQFVVSLDCMTTQLDGFADLLPGVTYLLASVALPAIFDTLDGQRCYVWDPKDDRKAQSLRFKHGYEVATVINGGGSVTISCISLSLNLGFRDLHIFGLDCMVPSRDKSHASGIAGQSVAENLFPVEIEGKQYLTSGPYIEFARQSLDLFSAGKQEGLLDSVKVYGESLVNKMWDGRFDHEEIS